MKDQILKFLRKNAKKTFSERQIAHYFGLESGDYKSLRNELKELVLIGKVILHPDQHYSNRDENKVLKGDLKVHRDGFGFLIPEDNEMEDVFIPERYMNFAMNGDEVLVESFPSSKPGQYEGRVIKILKRSQQKVVGRILKHGRGFYVQTIDKVSQEIYIPKKNLGKATVGDYTLVNIIQYPGQGIVAVGEVEQIIGDQISDESLTQAILLKNNIFREFPKDVKAELKSVPKEVDEEDIEDDRHDLTHLPLITIDGVTAKDFDDAVCVIKRGKTYILYVCIADVTDYIKTGTAIEQEAYKRATSVYLPNECIPMLPNNLSNGICSLNPHVYRKTVTAEIHYNEKHQFTRAYFYKSLMKSKKRATYDEVEAFYDKTSDEVWPKPIKNSLIAMKELADKLMKVTEGRGALAFDLPEAELVYDAQGEIQNIQRSQRFFSHKLIEVFMVAANSLVGGYFNANGLPLLYRVHEEPDSVKVQQFYQMINSLGLKGRFKGKLNEFFKAIKGHPYEQFLQTVFLRSLKQAVYDPENVGHFGLGLKNYCHFTSPIRRYPDVTVHKQLKELMKNSPEGKLVLKAADLKKTKRSKLKPFYSFSALKTIGGICSKKERDAVEAERDVLKMRRSMFIRDHVHEKFFGVITRISKFAVSVELDPYFLEGNLPLQKLIDDYYVFDEKKMKLKGRRTRKVLSIGDRVWVTVEDVDVEKAEILLNLVPPKVKKRKKGKKRKGSR